MPALLASQRWFAAKNEPVSAIRLQRLHLWNANDRHWLLTWVDVDFHNMGSQQYFLPLSIVWDDAADDLVAAMRSSVLARVRQHARIGVLCDAFVDPAFSRALAVAMAAGRSESVDGGELRFSTTPSFATHLGFDGEVSDTALSQACASLEIDFPTVQGSNSAVILRPAADSTAESGEHSAFTEEGDGSSSPRLFLKCYRRLQQGINPELEIGRFLTDSSEFTNAAPLAGAIEFVDADGQPCSLAIVQGHVPNQGDAWTYTQSYLERLFEDHLALVARESTDVDNEPSDLSAHHAFCELMGTLGQRTAEMHLAFAHASSDDKAFAAQPVSADDLGVWSAGVQQAVHDTLDKLAAQADSLTGAARLQAALLIESREVLLEKAGRLLLSDDAGVVGSAWKTRHHGDYHLGQVLIDRNDFIIIDFEGEPNRQLSERRALHSPLKDVAGMLRSFDYASASALHRAQELWPDAAESFESVLDDWQAQTSAAFTGSYHTTSSGEPDAITGIAAGETAGLEDVNTAAEVPAASGGDELLDLMMLDKALYELRYELDHRPAWVHVPLRGLLRLLENDDPVTP